MTKQERMKRIDDGLRKANVVIENFKTGKTLVAQSGDGGPLDVVHIAIITNDILELLKAAAESISQITCEKLLEIIGGCIIAKKTMEKVMGKKGFKRFLKICDKYRNRKVSDALDFLDNKISK